MKTNNQRALLVTQAINIAQQVIAGKEEAKELIDYINDTKCLKDLDSNGDSILVALCKKIKLKNDSFFKVTSFLISTGANYLDMYNYLKEHEKEYIISFKTILSKIGITLAEASSSFDITNSNINNNVIENKPTIQDDANNKFKELIANYDGKKIIPQLIFNYFKSNQEEISLNTLNEAKNLAESPKLAILKTTLEFMIKQKNISDKESISIELSNKINNNKKIKSDKKEITQKENKFTKESENFLEAVYCIKNNDKAKLVKLMKKNEKLVSHEDSNGNTLIHFAAKFAKPKIIKFLLHLGCKADPVNDSNHTPLTIYESYAQSYNQATYDKIFKAFSDFESFQNLKLFLQDNDQEGCKHLLKQNPWLLTYKTPERETIEEVIKSFKFTNSSEENKKNKDKFLDLAGTIAFNECKTLFHNGEIKKATEVLESIPRVKKFESKNGKDVFSFFKQSNKSAYEKYIENNRHYDEIDVSGDSSESSDESIE